MQFEQGAPDSDHQREHFLPSIYHLRAPGLPQGIADGGGAKDRFLSGLIAPEGHSIAHIPHSSQYSVTPKLMGLFGRRGKLVNTLSIRT